MKGGHLIEYSNHAFMTASERWALNRDYDYKLGKMSLVRKLYTALTTSLAMKDNC